MRNGSALQIQTVSDTFHSNATVCEDYDVK